MHYHIHRTSAVSRHTFHSLVGLWIVLVLVTFAAALLMSTTAAKADIIVPFTKAEKIFAPAVLQNFSSSPSPALVNERCQSYLHPTRKGSANIISSSRNQRNAEPQGVQTIVAIKAYRQCVSQIVLEQLANK